MRSVGHGNTRVTGALIVLAVVAGCWGCSTAPYTIGRSGDIVTFVGRDTDAITDDRPDDVFEPAMKGEGTWNRTKAERVAPHLRTAAREIAELAAHSDTSVLLNSLRFSCQDGDEMDRSVREIGNLVVLRELAKRRPLPADVLGEYRTRLASDEHAASYGDDWPTGVLLPDASWHSPLSTLDDLMEYATEVLPPGDDGSKDRA